MRMLAPILVIGVAAAGCSAPSGSRPSRGPTTSVLVTTAPPDPSTGPEVINAGTEPRRPLRLTLRQGTTSTVAITTDLRLAQDGGAGPVVIDPPPFTQVVTMRIGPLRSGRAEVSVRVDDVSVTSSGTDLTAAEALMLTKALQPIKGLEANGRLSATGRLTGVRFKVPKGLSTQARAQVDALPDQLTRLMPMLPAEAVGVGGSWRSRSTVSIAGVAVEQTDTVSIAAIDGDLVSYRSTSVATAARQELTGTSAPADTPATLLSSKANGEGTGTIDLASLATTASTDVSVRQRVRLDRGNDPATTVEQVVKVATRVRHQPS